MRKKACSVPHLWPQGNALSRTAQKHQRATQGTLLKRHRARVTDIKTGASVPASPSAFAIGAPITLYGRTFYLTDADPFTRGWFRTNTGTDLPLALPIPTGAIDLYKAGRARSKASIGPPSCRTDDLARFNEAKLGKPSHVLQADSLAQFLVRPLCCKFCAPLLHARCSGRPAEGREGGSLKHGGTQLFCRSSPCMHASAGR
jgi:hypothetical protein